MEKMPAGCKKMHLKYLDELRESGVTNMWGATAYLEGAFDMPHGQAKDILLYWIKTFSERHPHA